MAIALWAWLLALCVNTADTILRPPNPTANYKTFYIEQPVSINAVCVIAESFKYDCDNLLQILRACVKWGAAAIPTTAISTT